MSMTARTVMEEYVLYIPDGATHYMGPLYGLSTFYKVISLEEPGYARNTYFFWDRVRDKWYPYDEESKDLPALKMLKFIDQKRK